MCGIAGIISLKPSKSNYLQLLDITRGVEERGQDASGIAYIDSKGKVFSDKEDKKVSDKIDEWKTQVKSIGLGLGHARKKTVGDPKDNDNNHPIIYKSHYLIHNGSVTMPGGYTAVKFKTSIPGEVDSRHILEGIVDKIEEKETVISGIKFSLDVLYGAVAGAYFNATKPDEIYLFRKSNPLEIALDKETQTIYFASTRTAITSAFGVETEKDFIRSKASKLYWFTLAENTGLRIKRKETTLEWTEFDVSHSSATLLPASSLVTVDVKEGVKMHGLRFGVWGLIDDTVSASVTPEELVERYSVGLMSEDNIRRLLSEIWACIPTLNNYTNKDILKKFFNLVLYVYLPDFSDLRVVEALDKTD